MELVALITCELLKQSKQGKEMLMKKKMIREISFTVMSYSYFNKKKK